MSKNNKRVNQKALVAASFHKTWLTRIRKALGSRCTYISHYKTKNEYFIKVKMKNSIGGIDTISYKLQGQPDTLTSKDYQSLLTMLNKGEYEQGSTRTLSDIKGE